MPAEARFEEALRVLARHEADFIVVGGIAAILQGSPLTTEDVDILYLPTDENCRRLAASLVELEATYADPAGRRIEPDARRLATARIHLLNTSCGRVDLMRSVGNDLGYEQLIRRTRELEVADTRLHILELDAIIETKEQADRPKDRYQLPYLRQLLAEIRRLEEE